jgi:hypothetical protein
VFELDLNRIEKSLRDGQGKAADLDALSCLKMACELTRWAENGLLGNRSDHKLT